MSDALWGFGGALVGAGAALIGTLVSLRHAQKLQREQWDRETAERRLVTIKEAYFEFFTACHRSHVDFIGLRALPKAERDARAMQLMDTARDDAAVFGSKVRLLEPCAVARNKTGDILSELAKSMGIVSMSTANDFMADAKVLNVPLVKLAEFEAWLIETRFVPGYVPKLEAPRPVATG
jgi:hypothetical protein